MSKLIHQAIDSLLKETSRSFYLTLKALPPRIRPQIGLGYLLARIAGQPVYYGWGYGGQFIILVPELKLVVVTTSSSNPGDERRPHLRQLYDLIEHLVIAPVSNSVARP